MQNVKTGRLLTAYLGNKELSLSGGEKAVSAYVLKCILKYYGVCRKAENH